MALASPEPELPTLHLDLACDPLEVGIKSNQQRWTRDATSTKRSCTTCSYGNFLAFNPFQDKQNIDEPVASIHLDPLLVSKMTSICSNLKFASFQIGTEGHYRVSPLGPALDLFDSMNNGGMSSNMSVGSINNYNGYGHESAYAPPHTMNQVHQELDEWPPL